MHYLTILQKIKRSVPVYQQSVIQVYPNFRRTNGDVEAKSPTTSSYIV